MDIEVELHHWWPLQQSVYRTRLFSPGIRIAGAFCIRRRMAYGPVCTPSSTNKCFALNRNWTEESRLHSCILKMVRILIVLPSILKVYQTPWPESASELSDRHFSAKLVPRGQRDGSLRPYSRFSRPESLLFLPSSSSIEMCIEYEKGTIDYLVKALRHKPEK
jgi:hypothetical protein